VRRAFVVLVAAVVCSTGQSAPRQVPAFDHVVVVVLENKARRQVLGNRDAPAFNAFARTGAVLTAYRGVTHPSLPNYLALVSGSTHGISSDCTSCTVDGRSLADTLEARKLTWKAYAEGLPRAGWTGPARGRYAKKHVPFLYFRRVLERPARLRRIVPLAQLSRDRAAGRLPNFALVVPDLCHDMHDCTVATGDAWLKRFLPPLLKLPGTAVFVVFDESATADPGVPALALGSPVRAHSYYASAMSHYGLLRTIEEGFGLPLLGRSARAASVTGIWRLPPSHPKEGSAARP
jgi:phosphatidylinositol-3-phosphatase